MQLEKIVAYHKALGDPTRIRMLRLLAGGELNGQVLAEKLGVTPPTVTHHAAKLREASLIKERREKNSVFFSLYDYILKSNEQAALEFIYRKPAAEGTEMEKEAREKYKRSVLKNFFQADGRLVKVPSQLKKKMIVLESLAEKLEFGRTYPEAELNRFIEGFFPDYATVRREFIIHQYMYREDGIYELNPRDLWERWEDLN